jgi:hypothetical protein
VIQLNIIESGERHKGKKRGTKTENVRVDQVSFMNGNPLYHGGGKWLNLQYTPHSVLAGRTNIGEGIWVACNVCNNLWIRDSNSELVCVAQKWCTMGNGGCLAGGSDLTACTGNCGLKVHTVCLALKSVAYYTCEECGTNDSGEDGDTLSWTDSQEEDTIVVAEKKKYTPDKINRELRKLSTDLVGETTVENVIVEDDAHLDLDLVDGIVVTSMSNKRKEEDRKRKETIRQMTARESARKERVVNEYQRK